MRNDNLYEKLRCIFLVLAIISMIIALTKKVHAMEMSEENKEICNQYFNQYMLDAPTEWINEAYANCEYFIIYKIKTTRNRYAYQIDMFNYLDIGALTMELYNNQYCYYTGKFCNTLTIAPGDASTVRFNYCITDNNNRDFSNLKIYRFSSKMNDNENKGFYGCCKIINNNTLDGTLFNNNFYNVWCKGYTANGNADWWYYDNNDIEMINYYGRVILQKNENTFQKYENINDVTSNTNGFSVFIYNNLGIDTIRIVPPKNKVQVGTHTSNNSTVTFDLNIDGTTIPTTFNSNSEYYFESMEYNIAYYEIPFSALLASSINDFSSIYVTNVVYANEWGNQGGETGTDTFYYFDKVYLKQTIENEDIGQVTITHIDSQTGYDETHITDIYNMITNASTISGDFDTEKNLAGGSSSPYNFTSFQDAVVKTVECYHPTGTKDNDWTPIISEDSINIASGDNMYWLEYLNRNDVIFNNRYNYNISPYKYIRENNYTGYYDILYFIVHEQIYTSNGTGFSILSNTYTRYYYFISDRYYNKLILYREMDIMEYIELNNKISEKIYNYLYDRLLNIDDNIYYYIKDKANIDNDILTALENIDNDMQFNFDIINDILSRILNALSELRLSQLDTIETKLNTIISNIEQSNTENEDDTVAEAIQYYKSNNTNGFPTAQVYIEDKMSIWISGKVHLWLQGTDANTDKTNLINSVFETLTSIYDSMKNNNDIFPNIQYYLDAIAKNNNYGYETHGDYMTRLFKGNVDISTYNGISE